MQINQLKELIKQVVKEENDYQQLFKTMLDKSGKDINSMSDDEKKKFFNAVDKAYKAKSEGKLRGYNESAEKKKVNENFDLTPYFQDLSILLLIKFAFFFLISNINNIKKSLKGSGTTLSDVETKAGVELAKIFDNKNFCEQAAKLTDKGGINNEVAKQIVNLPIFKSELDKILKKKEYEEANRNKLENAFIEILVDLWKDPGALRAATLKIKQDIKL